MNKGQTSTGLYQCQLQCIVEEVCVVLHQFAKDKNKTKMCKEFRQNNNIKSTKEISKATVKMFHPASVSV